MRATSRRLKKRALASPRLNSLLAKLLSNNTDEVEAWTCAQRLRLKAPAAIRKKLIVALANEPFGTRQAALLEAIAPGSDAAFLSLIEKIVRKECDAYASDARAVAAEHLAYAAGNKVRARKLLLHCLGDSDPAVRLGALFGVRKLLSDVRLWMAVEMLVRDTTLVRSTVIGEFAHEVLNDHLDEICTVFSREAKRPDCAFATLIEMVDENWALQNQIEKLRLEQQFRN